MKQIKYWIEQAELPDDCRWLMIRHGIGKLLDDDELVDVQAGSTDYCNHGNYCLWPGAFGEDIKCLKWIVGNLFHDGETSNDIENKAVSSVLIVSLTLS